MDSFEVRGRRGYTHVFNDMLPPDGSLSAKAWGLYVYLIGRPPGWQIRGRQLATVFKDGKHSIYAGLDELVDAGLACRERYRERNLMLTRYVVFADRPLSSGPGFQDPENQDVVTTDSSKRRAYRPLGEDGRTTLAKRTGETR